MQKAVKTRTLKECKKFYKVLLSEEKSRNRELKSLLRDMCRRVETSQPTVDQIFDVLITTVESVEVVEECRHILLECADAAVDTAPSVVRVERERGRARREEELLRTTPWMSVKTRTKQSIPRVLARAIRSMLRNGTLTKPRAHKLVSMYRRAPTLEEVDEEEVEAEGVTKNLTNRSVESMVGEAVRLAEEDEPFVDLELEETVIGSLDTHGRMMSRMALRRHESVYQRECLHRDREFTLLSQRSARIRRELAMEEERRFMVLSDMEQNKYKRDMERSVAEEWLRSMEAEGMRMEADVRLRKTWCAPKSKGWSPPTTEIVVKEKLVVGSDGQPEKEEDGVTLTGRKESYEEVVEIGEKRSLEIQVELVGEMIGRETSVVETLDEASGEMVSARDEEGNEKRERIHPMPINIELVKWINHEYDEVGEQPVWLIQVEMPDVESMESVSSLLPSEWVIEKGESPSSSSFSPSPHLTARPLRSRFDGRQKMRGIEYQRLMDLVRRENAKVFLLERTVECSSRELQVRTEHHCDVREELTMFHRRCGAVNRMEAVHKKLLGWIAHRASRSMQTKDELLLLAKNAQHKVKRAQRDLDDANNPLAKAFCEQRMFERLTEADKVLRYVRKRFHAELDVRRKLAEERRQELLQQCARLEVVGKMSGERMRMLRTVRRSQEKEMERERERSGVEVKHAYEYEVRRSNSVEETVLEVVGDLLIQVVEKVGGEEERVEDEEERQRKERKEGRVSSLKMRRSLVVKSMECKQSFDRERETTLQRGAAREREHAVILEEIEKLEGAAGEWLADNQVQQAEDQLAVARSALEDQKGMIEEIRNEARSEYEDLLERMEVAKITSRARDNMLKNEIDSRRRSAGLAIAHMQKVAEQARDALEHLREEKDAEIMRMAEAHAVQMSELNARLEELELLAERRGKWVNTLQVQIRLMRKEKEEAELKFKKERASWERERDGLTKQLNFQTTQATRRLEWVESLKVEVETRQKEKETIKTEHERELGERRTRERELKWNVWQRDETARRIRMDVGSVFKWFLESVANLAGASKRHNDDLYRNGCVGVLNAIISRETERSDLKPLAARALGSLAWNGFVDHRVISRRSRDAWSAWIGVVASEEKWRFDLGEDEMRATIEAEASALRAAQEEKSRAASLANRTVRLLKEAYSNVGSQSREAASKELVVVDGVLGPEYKTVVAGVENGSSSSSSSPVRIVSERDAMREIGPNDRNQEAIGASYNALSSLVELCGHGQSEDMRRYASDAIAVLSITKSNRDRMEQIQSIFNAMIGLCDMENSPEIQRNAAAALGNMSFQHMPNQTTIGDSDGIEALCTLCGLSLDVDVLENATAALVNLSRSHEQNALRVGTSYGIEALVRLTNSTATADLSTGDGERVQGNAAEALVNATRNDSHENAERIRSCGVRPIVLMCTSENLVVQRAAPLVLGNIAQNDAIRSEVGSNGGIDALFLLAGLDDHIVQSNAAYALGNLAWTASNQERIGFFLPQLLQLLHSVYPNVRSNAMIALANTVHFHESNRRRLMYESPGSMELLVKLLEDDDVSVRTHAARCVGAACHNDVVAKLAGEYLGMISSLVRLLWHPSGQAQRFAAFALKNLGAFVVLCVVLCVFFFMNFILSSLFSLSFFGADVLPPCIPSPFTALYDPNKKRILVEGGVEGLTNCAGSESHQARDMAAEVMEVLADVAGENEMDAMKDKFGPGGMIELLRTNAKTNTLVAGLAADSIGEKCDGSDESRDSFIQAGAIEALLFAVTKEKDGSRVTEMGDLSDFYLKTLWTLRSLLKGHLHGRDRFGDGHGIVNLLELLNVQNNEFARAEEIKTVSLSILVESVVDHERNSRRLLRSGLDRIIELAEKILPLPPRKSVYTPKTDVPGSGPESPDKKKNAKKTSVVSVGSKKPWQMIKGEEKDTSQMALEILQLVGPHGWVVCTNCGTRAPGGTVCSHCGHKGIVFAE